MIRDGAPPEWTPIMRLVAGEIADDARDPDQDSPLPDGELPWSAIPMEGDWRSNRWKEGLAERCGMSARAISRVLTELAAAGYEMRVPITDRNGNPVIDKRGRLVFAAKGHSVRFVVPHLIPRPEPERSPDPAAIVAQRTTAMATYDAQSTPDPATKALDRSPDLARKDGRSSPEAAAYGPQRSPLLVSKVAEFGDPISLRSPQPLSPHENQSPQSVARSAHPEAEVPRAAVADSDGIDSGTTGHECKYARCLWRDVPVETGEDYHPNCKLFAGIKAPRRQVTIDAQPQASADLSSYPDDYRDELPEDFGDGDHAA